ncbi:MAG: galactosyldiacylglycerol synthase [Thermoanaerobaculia bacterium]
MVQLFDKQTGAGVGTLTDDQFQFLVDHLEEESSDDDDYYLNRSTVDVLESAGADPQLVQVLRRALGDREDMDLRWTRS